MRYAIIENELVLNIVEAEPAFAEAQGWIPCPETDETGRAISPGDGYSNGKFFLSQQNRDAIAAVFRKQRDALLLASDTAVLPDRWAAMSAEQQTAWSAYRQALRDVPQQTGFPTDVVWPVRPGP